MILLGGLVKEVNGCSSSIPERFLCSFGRNCCWRDNQMKMQKLDFGTWQASYRHAYYLWWKVCINNIKCFFPLILLVFLFLRKRLKMSFYLVSLHHYNQTKTLKNFFVFSAIYWCGACRRGWKHLMKMLTGAPRENWKEKGKNQTKIKDGAPQENWKEDNRIPDVAVIA